MNHLLSKSLEQSNATWKSGLDASDNQGAAGYNRRLSLACAEAVRDWLVGQGIEAGRLTTRGYGATAPTAPNDTEEGRARNRRIEFKRTN